MKTTKLLLTLAAGTLLAVTSAQAQVNIYISGAVAFRDTAYTAIGNLFGPNLTSVNNLTAPPLSLKTTWSGKITNLFGEQTVTVRAFYNGAVAGIQDLAQNRDVLFLASSTQGSLAEVTNKSDIAFSSIRAESTEFAAFAGELEVNRFGATPINFVKSSSAPANITNLTTHQFKTLASNGKVPAWFLTGDLSQTNEIFFINRDPTAGQRVTVFLESLFDGDPIQYAWSGTAYTNDLIGRNPAQITAALNTGGPAISYLISGDSYAVNSGQNVLSYNGSKAFRGTFNNITNDFTPLITGQYSLWVYEFLLNKNTAAGNTKTFRAALQSAIDQQLQTSFVSIPESRLKVSRQGDGSPVTPNTLE